MSHIANIRLLGDLLRCLCLGLRRAGQHRPARPGWRWRPAVAALTLLLVASALLPPSRPALAEIGIGASITVGSGSLPGAYGVAVNPISNRIYVTNVDESSVSVINGPTNTVAGQPIPVGTTPQGIAFNPTSFRVYVANYVDGTVSVINAATDAVVGQPIQVGVGPVGVAVNPITNRIYVTNASSVQVIDGDTSTVLSPGVLVPEGALFVAVNPATNRIYVTHRAGSSVTVIDGATNTVMGSPIAVGTTPRGIAADPITNRIYVAAYDDNRVTVIDGATNGVVGQGIPTGPKPAFVAVNPATSRLYVTDSARNTITIVDTSTDPVRISSAVVGAGGTAGIEVNPVSGRVYVAHNGTSVSGLGVPLTVEAAPNQPVGTIGVGWAFQSPSNGADFVGLFDENAPNSAPLSRIYTNGTASPGGPGAGAAAVNLPIPAGLPFDNREIRFVSGAGGGTFALRRIALPVAGNDSYSTRPSTPITMPAPGVLANDVGADGAPVQARLVSNPANGTLALQPNGTFTYTPRAGFTGIDSFTYQATDPFGLPAIATATIVVSTPPVARDDAYSVVAGTVLDVSAPGVLANDADPDSPSLQASVVTGPANGTLSLQPSGSFSYTPNGSYVGPDRFTYRATDETGLSSTATVAITVTAPPVPAPPSPTPPGPTPPGPTPVPAGGPVAMNDTYAVANGSVLTASAPGVLVNDTGASPLRVEVERGPAHGALSLQPGGAFTYSPGPSFAGSDTFEYRATDQAGQSATATVTINVTPVACGPRPTVRLQTAIVDGALQATVLASDVDGPTRNRLKELRFGAPTNGRVELAGQTHDGPFAYPVPPETVRVTFAVRRASPGQATTVPLTVVDECGAWPTLVGGGTGAGF
jgi:YVTN family beta-propeller protein